MVYTAPDAEPPSARPESPAERYHQQHASQTEHHVVEDTLVLQNLPTWLTGQGVIDVADVKEYSFHPDGKAYITFPSEAQAKTAATKLCREGLRIHHEKSKAVDWKGVSMHRLNDPHNTLAVQVRIEDRNKVPLPAKGLEPREAKPPPVYAIDCEFITVSLKVTPLGNQPTPFPRSENPAAFLAGPPDEEDPKHEGIGFDRHRRRAARGHALLPCGETVRFPRG